MLGAVWLRGTGGDNPGHKTWLQAEKTELSRAWRRVAAQARECQPWPQERAASREKGIEQCLALPGCAGPGVTNLVTALATANCEGDPIVALGGNAPIAQRYKATHQASV